MADKPTRAELPADATGHTVQLTPRASTLKSQVQASISSATTITLQQDTTFLRLYASGQDVFLKWGQAPVVSSSNFDEIIPAGQIVDLAVPDKSPNVRFQNIQIIERAATATIVVIEK